MILLKLYSAFSAIRTVAKFVRARKESETQKMSTTPKTNIEKAIGAFLVGLAGLLTQYGVTPEAPPQLIEWAAWAVTTFVVWAVPNSVRS